MHRVVVCHSDGIEFMIMAPSACDAQPHKAAGDYINAELLGNPGTKMIGNVIAARYLQIVDYPGAAALSLILMATILILVMLYVKRAGTEELV